MTRRRLISLFWIVFGVTMLLISVGRFIRVTLEAEDHPLVREMKVGDGDILYGDEKARKTIVVLLSPTCPHCQSWVKKDLPQVSSQLSAWNARLIVRLYPQDGEALHKSEEVLCLPRQYLRKALTQIMIGDVSPDQFLDGDGKMEWQACMKDHKTKDDIIKSSFDAKTAFRVIGTPTFVIRGVVITHEMSVEEIRDRLE